MSSRESDTGPKTWTINVCPECNEWSPHSYCRRHDTDGPPPGGRPKCLKVTVAPKDK